MLLEDWEYWCCGERRRIGDEVQLQVRWCEGVLYETRHTMPGEVSQTRLWTCHGDQVVSSARIPAEQWTYHGTHVTDGR